MSNNCTSLFNNCIESYLNCQIWTPSPNACLLLISRTSEFRHIFTSKTFTTVRLMTVVANTASPPFWSQLIKKKVLNNLIEIKDITHCGIIHIAIHTLVLLCLASWPAKIFSNILLTNFVVVAIDQAGVLRFCSRLFCSLERTADFFLSNVTPESFIRDRIHGVVIRRVSSSLAQLSNDKI